MKGGSILGLQVLKLLINSGNFNINMFNDFMELNLIKDWDFSIFCDDNSVKAIFNEHNFKIESQINSPICISRRINKIKLPSNDYLFEISIKETNKNAISDCELPISAMKIRLDTKDKINNMFILAKHFYELQLDSTMVPNINLIVRIVSAFTIELEQSLNGLFDINEEENIQDGGLNPDTPFRKYIDSIEPITVLNGVELEPFNINNIKQFLIVQIIEPSRLFMRFYPKNLKKNNKIIHFLEKNSINSSEQPWLITPEFLIIINYYVINFLAYIQTCLMDIYSNYKNCIELLNYFKKEKLINQDYIDNCNNLLRCDNISEDVKKKLRLIDHNKLNTKIDTKLHALLAINLKTLVEKLLTDISDFFKPINMSNLRGEIDKLSKIKNGNEYYQQLQYLLIKFDNNDIIINKNSTNNSYMVMYNAITKMGLLSSSSSSSSSIGGSIIHDQFYYKYIKYKSLYLKLKDSYNNIL